MEATGVVPGARAPEPEPRPAGRRERIEARAAARALALVPGALIIYLGFNAGGFFPGGVAFAAILLAQMILIRVLLADRPLSGASRALALTTLLFAGYAAWTLASGGWSHSRDRPLLEFDRALLYLNLLVLFGTVARRSWHAQWLVRGVVAGSFVVCAAGFISRTLPHVWPTTSDLATNRLSFPVTYWNALGILCAIGLLMAFALASSVREPRIVRVAAAAAIPIFAATMLLTYSRGAIVACVLGAAVLTVLARPLAVVSALISVLPPTAVAVVVTYHASQLASANPTSAAAVAQGRHVAIVAVVCVAVAAALRLLMTLLDRPIAEFAARASTLPARRAAAAATALGVVVVLLALNAPSWVSRQTDVFFRGAPVPNQGDIRNRLTDPSNGGRTEHWRVALKVFSKASFHGTGAGTYEFNWARYRNTTFSVLHAHSLYLQALSDLGVVGFVLLVGTLVAILLALAARARGPNRVLYAGLLAAGIAWVVHAAIDWDWEMPVTVVFLFAAGGLALARRAPAAGRDELRGLGDRWRVPIALALLFVCVAPALVFLSQSRLEAAASSLGAGNCPRAVDQAGSSINVLATRPQPYEVLGYCDLIQGRPADAVAALEKAVQQEPAHWEYRYVLAVALASAGRDPRPQIRLARELNPLHAVTATAAAAFSGTTPASWQRAARGQVAAAIASPTVSLR